MSGLTTGPRQFNFQTQKSYFTGNATASSTGTGWRFETTIAGSNYFAIAEEKVSLRAFNSNPGKGLSILNVAVQEGGAWSATTTDPTNSVPGCLVIDLISSVQIPIERWEDIIDSTNGLNANMPGFLNEGSTNDPTRPANRQYNTSQIIYGMWRVYGENRNVMYGSPPLPTLGVFQSGQFGSGEMLVAPHAYYYKLVVTAHEDITVQIPACNCSVHGAVVSVPEFAELGQMARLGQR